MLTKLTYRALNPPLPLCVLSFLLAGHILYAQDAATKGELLCIMTYNLRFASSNPPNAWSQRRPLMRECIEKVSPDVMGTQEGLYQQLKDLAADLPHYDWIGLGRDGGSKGEFMAVFYRKARLEPLAFDHFWLSDTPSVIASTTWGNSTRRMVTSIQFLDRRTRNEFYVFNTHFDHQVQRAREKSAELIRQHVQELNTSLPILLIGDFNAGRDNKAYEILTENSFFLDTWDLAKTRRGEGLGTFNSFKEISKNGKRIDWILARGTVAVKESEVVTFTSNGLFPSDHCPVVAHILFQ